MSAVIIFIQSFPTSHRKVDMEHPIDYLLSQDLTSLQVAWSIVGENSAHADECWELANYDLEVARRYVRTRCGISASLFGYLLAGNGTGWEEGDRWDVVCIRLMKIEGVRDRDDENREHVFILLKYDGERFLLESRVNEYEPRIERVSKDWDYNIPEGYRVEMYSHPLLPGVKERVEKVLNDLLPVISLSDEYSALL